jgi:O-antigen ligase
LYTAYFKRVTVIIIFLVYALLIGVVSVFCADYVYLLLLFLVLPFTYTVMRLKIQLIYLIIMILPVMFYKVIGIEVNISYADFLIPFMVIPIIRELSANGFAGKDKEIKILVTYGLGLLTAFSISLANIAINENSNIIYGISNLMKVFVNMFYSFVFLFCFKRFKSFEKKFLKIWTYTAVIFALICIIGVLLYAVGKPTPFTFYYRARGTFEDPNLAACYLNMSLGIVLAYNYLNYGRVVRCNAILIILALFLTASRGGILSLAMGLIILISFNFRRETAKSLIKMVTAFIIILCIVYMAANSLGYNILSNVDNRIISIGSDDYNTLERILLWDTAMELGMKRPIIGVGTGQYVSVASISNPAVTKIPHNTYLGIFAETGIVGLTAFMWLPVFLAFKLYKKIRNGEDILLFFALSMLCVGIQAYSINMENYRILWIGYSLLLYYCGKPAADRQKPIVDEGKVDYGV